MSNRRSFDAWQRGAGDTWSAYTRHAFVAGLGDGTLPREALLHYLVQDYVFLIRFSRAWALAVAKAEKVEEMRLAAGTGDGLIKEELPLHVGICAEAGILVEALFAADERPENLAYTVYVLDAGHSGDPLDLLAALAPCVMSYGEIGTALATTATSDTYRPWIHTYAGADYENVCTDVDKLTTGPSPLDRCKPQEQPPVDSLAAAVSHSEPVGSRLLGHGTATMIQALTLSAPGRADIARVPILSDLDLMTQAGEWTVILVASGVGKSTMLRLFAGLSDGIDLTGELCASTGTLMGQVALMTQDDLLMPWLSVLDNARIGVRLRGDQPKRAMALGRVHQVGLEECAEARIAALSGEQRQPVASARTLMQDRPIMLLDMPFSVLDALTRVHMQELSAEVLQSSRGAPWPGRGCVLWLIDFYHYSQSVYAFTVPAGDIPRPFEEPAIPAAQAPLLHHLRSPPP